MTKHFERGVGENVGPAKDDVNRNVASQRAVADSVGPASDHVQRKVTQIRIEKNWKALAAAIALIVVPPVATGLLSLAVPALPGFIIGIASAWILGAVGFYAGYKGLTKRVTVDRN